MSDFRNDLFDPKISFSIEEADTEVDGQHVLAKVKGTFFVPEGKSRNKRFYPKEVWEKTLANKDIKERIESKRMFGTISHNQKLDDTALLEGKFSHIVTDLSLNKDGQAGYGEALILNTPAGQVLNTVLRAGSKLFVSSRASGDFKGKTDEGLPKVDPDNYHLESFDFVIEPGFVEANPSIMESLKKIHDENDSNVEPRGNDPVINSDGGNSNMEQVLESLTREKVKLENSLSDSLKMLEELKSANTILTDEGNHLKDQLADLQEKAKVFDADSKVLEGYKGLGTPEEINKAFDTVEPLLNEYKKLGSTQDISKCLDILEEYKALGSTEELNKSLDFLEDYSKLGTVKEIDEVFNKTHSHFMKLKDLGTLSQIEEAFDKSSSLITEYKHLGTPSEISEAFEKTKEVVKSIKETSDTQRISDLAKELNVSDEAVRRLYDKMSEDELKSHFNEVSESVRVTNKYKKQDKTTSITKEVDESSPLNKSRVSRLIGMHS